VNHQGLSGHTDWAGDHGSLPSTAEYARVDPRSELLHQYAFLVSFKLLDLGAELIGKSKEDPYEEGNGLVIPAPSLPIRLPCGPGASGWPPAWAFAANTPANDSREVMFRNHAVRLPSPSDRIRISRTHQSAMLRAHSGTN